MIAARDVVSKESSIESDSWSSTYTTLDWLEDIDHEVTDWGGQGGHCTCDGDGEREGERKRGIERERETEVQYQRRCNRVKRSQINFVGVLS